jgi:hypothetical protein
VIALSVLMVSLRPAFTERHGPPGQRIRDGVQPAGRSDRLDCFLRRHRQGTIAWRTEGIAVDDSTIREQVARMLAGSRRPKDHSDEQGGKGDLALAFKFLQR